MCNVLIRCIFLHICNYQFIDLNFRNILVFSFDCDLNNLVLQQYSLNSRKTAVFAAQTAVRHLLTGIPTDRHLFKTDAFQGLGRKSINTLNSKVADRRGGRLQIFRDFPTIPGAYYSQVGTRQGAGSEVYLKINKWGS